MARSAGNRLRGLAVPGRARPIAAIELLLDELRAAGYREVITNALAPGASLPLVDCGFEIRGRLHLLSHDLAAVPAATRRTRRSTGADRDAILDVDTAAFEEFWRLDARRARAGRARDAAIRSCASPAADPIDGYALFGRADRTGYVQRLAIHPRAQGEGLGLGAPHRRSALAAHARRPQRIREHPGRQRPRAAPLRAGRLPPAAGRAVRARANALSLRFGRVRRGGRARRGRRAGRPRRSPSPAPRPRPPCGPRPRPRPRPAEGPRPRPGRAPNRRARPPRRRPRRPSRRPRRGRLAHDHHHDAVDARHSAAARRQPRLPTAVDPDARRRGARAAPRRSGARPTVRARRSQVTIHRSVGSRTDFDRAISGDVARHARVSRLTFPFSSLQLERERATSWSASA